MSSPDLQKHGKVEIINFLFIIPWSACQEPGFCWEVEMKAKENPELLHRVKFQTYLSGDRLLPLQDTALLLTPRGPPWFLSKFSWWTSDHPQIPYLTLVSGPSHVQRKTKEEKSFDVLPLKITPTTMTSLIWSPGLAVKLYCLKSLGFKNNLFSCACVCPRCPFIEFTEYKWKKVIPRQKCLKMKIKPNAWTQTTGIRNIIFIKLSRRLQSLL